MLCCPSARRKWRLYESFIISKFRKLGEKKRLSVVRGVVVALVVSFAAFAILAAVMLWGGMGEGLAGPLAIAVSVVSIVIGAFITARGVGEKGWLWGAVCGLMYYFVVYICALSAMMEFNFSFKTLLMLLVGAVCGMIGGIFGVNAGAKKRRR